MKTLRTRKKRLARSGFTLLELLIVLAIIVSLAAMVAPNLMSSQQDAQISTTRADIRNIETAIKTKRIKTGGMYEEGSGPEVIEQLIEPYEHNGQQQQPVMEDLKKDPWGKKFQYSYSQGDVKPMIWSFGPNGKDDNGEGDDISNIQKYNDNE